MSNKTYILTSEQLESLDHFQYLLSVYASQVEKLCLSEDVNIGFELGKLYSSLRSSFISFRDLNSDIRYNTKQEESTNE